MLFDELVTQATAEVAANYTVSGATVSSVVLHAGRVAQLNLAGAVPASFTVTVRNVSDLAGNAMPSTTVTGELVTDMTAADIGNPGVDPLLPGAAFAFGKGGFYVAGGGHDIWDNADGFHYVYKQFTGAFDMRANLLSLTGTHQWAKAVLMVRETLDGGSRQVNSMATRSDGNGQNNFGMQWRDATNGASGWPGSGVNLRDNANYPNAWLRLVREDAASNEFKAYWSNNGVSWNLMGTYTVPAPAWPATTYVGMAVTSHDNAATAPLAQAVFNQFSVKEFQAVVDPAEFTSVTRNPDGTVVVEWTGGGTLLSAPAVNGPWTSVAGASSPYQLTPSGAALFFQVRQ